MPVEEIIQNSEHDSTPCYEKHIVLSYPAFKCEVEKFPSMMPIFFKAFFVSFFRPGDISDSASVKRASIIMKNFMPDENLVGAYKKVCCFSENRADIIPITYLQTVFTGLLGKFITSSFFPINPLGLIHIFQSCMQIRTIKIGESFDLACTLDSITKTDKGIETAFKLEAISENEIVWRGISIFLSRQNFNDRRNSNNNHKAVLKKDKNIELFAHRETIFVPSDTGRQYARVSGDYNPHHLSFWSARIFGFRRAIAHGMWTLARVIACIDRHICINGALKIEAHFKLPVFMPAKINLGYECINDVKKNCNIVNFNVFHFGSGQNILPHLKGKLVKKEACIN